MERNRSFSQVLLKRSKGTLVSTSTTLLCSEQSNFIQSQVSLSLKKPCYISSLHDSLCQWSGMIPYIWGKLANKKLWFFVNFPQAVDKTTFPTQGFVLSHKIRHFSESLPYLCIMPQNMQQVSWLMLPSSWSWHGMHFWCPVYDAARRLIGQSHWPSNTDNLYHQQLVRNKFYWCGQIRLQIRYLRNTASGSVIGLSLAIKDRNLHQAKLGSGTRVRRGSTGSDWLSIVLCSHNTQHRQSAPAKTLGSKIRVKD